MTAAAFNERWAAEEIRRSVAGKRRRLSAVSSGCLHTGNNFKRPRLGSTVKNADADRSIAIWRPVSGNRNQSGALLHAPSILTGIFVCAKCNSAALAIDTSQKDGAAGIATPSIHPERRQLSKGSRSANVIGKRSNP
jgi:hypothetical protein